jgi:hypothetical protein
MNTKEKARVYFESNPSTAELFGTSDGTLFLLKRDAANHAASLGENQEVETFDRVEMASEEVEEAEQPEIPEGVELKRLRDEYKTVIGKAPFNGWTADQLEEKITEAKANPAT